MEKGTLIEFRLQGHRRLAVVDRPEGKKDWIVIDQSGHPHKLRPQRVEYTINGGPYRSEDIPSFLKQVEPYLDLSTLALAWELLVEEGMAITPEEMASLLFSESSPHLCYTAHSLLSEDKIYFKKKGDLYEPRPVNQVEEIKHQLEVEEQRKQEKEVFIARFNQALQGEKVDWSEADRSRLEVLEKYVLFPEQPSRNAVDVLTELGQSTTNPENVVTLLIELGWWSKHENLFLRRSSYPRYFSKKVLDVAQTNLTTPPPDPDRDRLDLTHLKVYTIDDESTKEIDDGLSVERIDSQTNKIWIHIADPTRLMSPGDELDLEARRRSTTLYLPTGMISMFPTELATGPMSLVQGKVCPALSFGVVLDSTGGVLDYCIHASLIKPTYRLTYEDVDEMLELDIQGEPEISILGASAKQRLKWRTEQGSINIQMPESSIKVSANDEITIELLDNSRSRQLVAEMMILAGEVGGRYCQDHHLPVPFRSQPQPELPPEEELILLPAGPVRSCALRRCMPRSEISINPARHASLGLNTYTQVTSPIRRYTDLLAHFQLKASLRGDPLPFSEEKMQEILFGVIDSVKEASSVERQTNRYWSLEYLRRQPEGVWQVLVLRWLREDENLALVMLEDLGIELAHRFERNVSLGDRLDLQVVRVDPHRDEIRFREMTQATV
ncbi:ribonuclease catalytic domain-containing protein [Gloeocapsa sp. PCC 73106]|uniref:ribonuclease catalytic domain-containing protein n=1 Tax=Gloeocapsa sp. PCC 73106 TaxID=102232 RepID=UPI0002ABDD8A|nr:ribonuclease R family protein [Gloeocapsa sp. PCC 73106]ELR96500.1 exoribonuclease R [Gloeocapsa sp. PCC 73106]